MYFGVYLDAFLLYVCGMDTGLEWSFGAIRWTHCLKLGAHVPERKSSPLFPNSVGAACETTGNLGLVLKADKTCVSLWILDLVRTKYCVNGLVCPVLAA